MKNMDEAVSLLSNYNIYFHFGSIQGGGHYFVSDSHGNSAVIEFLDGEMKVSDSCYNGTV